LRTAQYNENIWEDVLKVLIGETLLIDSMGGPQVRREGGREGGKEGGKED
jgi:hypothetical protein